MQSILATAGISQGEVKLIIESLQSEDEGEVKYEELVGVLHHIEGADMRKLAVISHVTMSHQFSQQQEKLLKHSEIIERMEERNAETLARLEGKLDILSRARTVAT